MRSFLFDEHLLMLQIDIRLVCQEETQKIYAANISLLDILQGYFAQDGALAVPTKCSFEDLSAMATKIYLRYMTNTASEDAQGLYERNREFHGPGAVDQSKYYVLPNSNS